MAGKNTYSLSALWQPDVEGNTYKQIASSGREITNIKLVSGVGSVHIDIYDSNVIPSATIQPAPTDLKWFMDVNPSGNDSDHFDYPLSFKKGIVAVMTSPAGNGAQLGFCYLPDQV